MATRLISTVANLQPTNAPKEPHLVTIYATDGSGATAHKFAVDARECVNSGRWSMTPPPAPVEAVPEKKPEPEEKPEKKLSKGK